MMVESKRENDTLIITLPERIDASNAAEAESEIESLRDLENQENVILDADKLQYISSAGLRIIIKLVKREKSVTVINVSPAVYDIFEVSGFTNFITIVKKDS
ncbi:MAG: STAS domain-containing protein [Solobacterium sp.]|nr:STAS domain-containing protein [Solobacterium sp.]